jgi:hypothetical protein
MIKIKKGTFTTDEHVDFVQERSASILKDHVALFTYKKSNKRNPETIKTEALKELTALSMPLQLPRRYRLQGVPNSHRKYYYHGDPICSPLTRVPLKQQCAAIEKDSRAEFRAQPIYSLCARSDQSCCGLATTTWPGVAALRALINKQHNQASRVVWCAFVRSEHAASSAHGAEFGTPKGNFGAPKQIAGFAGSRAPE